MPLPLWWHLQWGTEAVAGKTASLLAESKQLFQIGMFIVIFTTVNMQQK